MEAEGLTPWESAERVLVGLAIGGTALIGGCAAAFPVRSLALAGLEPGPSFLVRQIGVLLLVLALGYAMEFRRSRGVVLLLTAEGLTAAFLLASWLGERHAVQLLATAAQAALGGLTWAIHQHARRQRWARARLRLVPGTPERIRPAGGG